MNIEIMDGIIKAVVAIATAVITTIGIPWLVQLAKEYRDNWVTKLIVRFVRAAEQKFKSGEGEKKLEFVADLLEKAGIHVDDTVRGAIEEAVYSITNAAAQSLSDI